VKKMKKYDLTIVIPAFRVPLWENLYESAKDACKKYKWELLFVSPFDLPPGLQEKENVSLLKDYGNVVRCVQLGVQKAQGELFFLTVDDCVFAENSIDLAMEEYNKTCGEKDAMAMLYSEGGNALPKEYWTVQGPPGRPDIAAPLNLPGIDRSWRIANQCLMRKDRFIELGGVDAENFEYLDKPIHDFMFRLQRDGGKIHFSPTHVCIATHLYEKSGDHGPVHNAYHKDIPYFNMLYSVPHLYENRVKIDFDNWKTSPAIWRRRFSADRPETYEDLCAQQGYNLDDIQIMKEKLQEMRSA
tara:strand:+ start:16057 stop:16956 length:900 start_codon:yes stop_codon:yes gene_type:complete